MRTTIKERIFILRESIVKITQILAGSGIKVTQRGLSAYVKPDKDGRPVQVNLPYIPDNATEELCDAIQGFLDHEVAHVMFSDFKATNKIADDEKLHNIANIVEDARIEREMIKRFSGTAYNLANTGKFFLDKFIVPKLQQAQLGGDANTSIGILIAPLIRAMAGQQVFKEFMADKMDIVEPVYEKIKDLEKDIRVAESTSDAISIAKKIRERLAPEEPEGDGDGEGEGGSGKGEGGGKGKRVVKKSSGGVKKKPEEKKEEEEPKAGSGEKEKEKEEGGSEEDEGAGEEPEEKEEPEEPSEEGGEPDEEPEDEKGEGGDEGEEGDDDAGAEPLAGDDDEEPDESGEEDEGDDLIAPSEEDWENNTDDEIDASEAPSAILSAIDKENRNGFDDAISAMITADAVGAAKHAQYLVYTTEGDVIEPLQIGSAYRDDDFKKGIEEPVEHMVGPLQKDLERAISARSLSTFSNGHRSGRIHASNLSRLIVGDDRVFRRKLENHSKDVAVELVIDASGSMSGAKIQLAAQAGFALSSVLERLRISHEVIAFTTGPHVGSSTELAEEQRKIGREFTRFESLYMPVLKGFNERLNTETKARFGWLPRSRILRNNVDGECIEIAARRLMARREAGKVMIVLSDGVPAAAGDMGRLHIHLKETVERLTGAGINTVGIGIMSDSVRYFYPKHVIINRVEELPGRVMQELRHMLVPK